MKNMETQPTEDEANSSAVSEVLRSLRIDGLESDLVARAIAERYIDRTLSPRDLMCAIVEHLGDRCPRFVRYSVFPPPDSALARAIAFGVDPTMTFHNMFALTPEERFAQADRMLERRK